MEGEVYTNADKSGQGGGGLASTDVRNLKHCMVLSDNNSHKVTS